MARERDSERTDSDEPQQSTGGTRPSVVTVMISGDVDQVHTHHHETFDPEDARPILGAHRDRADQDDGHDALLIEDRKRAEFKQVTGGIDERASRRRQFQRLLDMDADPKELGILSKGGYLTFRNEVLTLDRGRAPAYGAATVFTVGNAPSLGAATFFIHSQSLTNKLVSLGIFSVWFLWMTFFASRIMTRWWMAQRLARRIDECDDLSQMHSEFKAKRP